jgi:hypothetical protein
LTGLFVERDKGHFVAVVEMAELFALGATEFSDPREEP